MTAVVASASGIEYGQFYSTGITTTPATMARVKGTIAVNNGRIQLKKGSSYHVTVRGRYNQTTAVNTNVALGYIEYVSNNTINVNVDKTLTDSQYFEISYDLYNLSNNVDYLVWFTGTDGGTVNDLWIEVHSLTGIGGQGGGGTGPTYEAGYGIQILNNIISVSGIAPQVNADWNAVSGVTEILNKPEEQVLVPGAGISIQNDGVSAIISTTGASQQVNSDWDAVSGVAEILNKPVEYNLVAGNNVAIVASGTDVIISSTGGGGGSTYTGASGVTVDNENDIISLESPVDVVAGPGIVIDNPDGNTMRISTEADAETVLWEGTASSTSASGVLSETINNFNYVDIYAQPSYNPNPVITRFKVNYNTTNNYRFMIGGQDGAAAHFFVYNTSLNGTSLLITRATGIQITYTNPALSIINPSSLSNGVVKVVGIHRIANN